MAKPDLTIRSDTWVVAPPAVVTVSGAGGGDSGGGSDYLAFASDPAIAQTYTGDSGAAQGQFVPPFIDQAINYDWSSVKGNIGQPGDQGDYFAFVAWCQANSISIAFRRFGNDLAYFTAVAPVRKHATGGYYAIGTPVITKDDPDTVFGLAIGLAASVVGFGEVYGIANSYASGNNAGVVTGALKAASGVDIPSTGGDIPVDDFETPDVTNYADSVDGFNYSSGESLVAYSDSQNVDFGFNSGIVAPTDAVANVALSPDIPGAPSTDTDVANFNNTPEVKTNDFGTTFEDNGTAGDGADVKPLAVKGVPLAGGAQAGAAIFKAASAGQVSGGGAASPKFSGTSQPDVQSTAGNVFDSALGAASTLGTAAQQTTALAKTFTGQLGPGGAAQGNTINGMPTQTLLLIGGALVALALVMHMKG